MATQDEGPTLTMPVDPDRDHIQGPESAPVTLVEYGDFECPHCGRAHGILTELLPQLGESVRFVFRHFPLAQVHVHAEHAAESAEAAAAQGQFWEMHDALFENQEALEDDNLVSYAEQLGLDIPRFAADLEQQKYRTRVSEDFRAGIRSGVNGTPTFFINGHRHNGAWDLEALRQAITHASQTVKKHHGPH
jgi:protein-disulfide isomerase